MRKGEATGPQRKPRAADAPAPQHEPEVGLHGDVDRLRKAWDRQRDRMIAEAEKLLRALYGTPPGDMLRVPRDLPEMGINDLELQLGKLGLRIQQLEDAL